MLRSFNQVLSNLLYWVTRSRWLLITALVGLVLLLLPTPEGLSVSGHRTLVLVIMTIMLIVTEPIPLPGIAFIVITLQVYFGIGEANDVAQAFMNDAVFFIMGSLMLAVAIVRQGWDARIALGIIKLTGTDAYRIAAGFVVISALMSSFIGEHTVAAMMLPIALTLIRFTSEDTEAVKKLAALLLFAIAYGSIIGSIGTPSGGARNAIMMIYWQDFGISGLSYARWMIFVYPLVFIQLPILIWILSRHFKPEVRVLDSGVRRLKVQVAKKGPVTGRQILAVIIFIFIFLGWIFLSEDVGLGIIALTGVVLYLITGLVKWDEINRHMNWGVVVLFGSTISLGTQIKITGAADWLASVFLSASGDLIQSSPVFTDGIIVLLTAVMANVLSSSATVAVLGPITLNLPGDPIHLGLVTAISSSFGFFTAVAAPACTIIYSSGLLKAKDFLQAGWKIGIISILTVIIYANFYWEFILK